jgi:putative Ca2+/H+ antiporter (TMEM165/GDT1 family)
MALTIILTSLGLVALAEIGDKTMLLAMLLATRFRRPLPIVTGIFAATICNHALAAWAGAEVAGLLDGFWFRLFVALGFIAMAGWTLVPDKADDLEAAPARYGAFLTTLVCFFMVEIGDKTQIATIALGARYAAVPHAVALVATGTTIGMMLVNVPAVYFGDVLTRIVPLRAVRIAAATIFAVLGLLGLVALFR